MNFVPRPENDFPEFIRVYFEHCRRNCPKLVAIGGKWTFEDLIPGLSDFDTRLIFSDGMSTADWHQTSLAVSRVHTELTRSHPRWARTLEHLPGLNLTVGEVTDPVIYYPEFPQWTFYDGDAASIQRIETYLAAKAWTRRDELFHLKRFATYFGPYQRGIDPPINMGPWENKYPLHSRYMHYFAPPIQAAVSLVRRRAVRGKLDSLRVARGLFPNPEVIDAIFDALDRHYELSESYAEPKLTEIEHQLETYLRSVYEQLAGQLTLIDVNPADSPAELRGKIAAVPIDPAEKFFEGVKFSRLMKGRLLFYAELIASFDSAWLIRNDLKRMVVNFHDAPLTTFALARFGSKMTPSEAVDAIRREGVVKVDTESLRKFAELVSAPIPSGGERQRAREAAALYDPLLETLENLGTELRKQLG